MQVIQVYIENSLDNFNYIIYAQNGLKAIHIDPFDIKQTLPRLDGLPVTSHYLINTHKHGDHIKDNLALVEETAAEKLNLQAGERFYLNEDEFIEALDTPGHTMDHQCYLLYQNGSPVGIITGDALFNAGVGNCKHGGDMETHFESISKIFLRLPGHLKIYPGHDYMMKNLSFAQMVEPGNEVVEQMLKNYQRGQIFTLDQEKQYNPFLRIGTTSMQKNFPNMSQKQIFLELRTRRDKL